MPRALKHCGIGGCTTLVPGGERCDEHKHRFVNGGTTRTSDPRHRAWRRRVLNNAGGLCEIRIVGRCLGRATEADHIIEVADGGAEFDPANGQAVCGPCHEYKTSRHAHRTRWGQTT